MSALIVKLGDICNIQSGGTPSRGKSEFWEGGCIPWVKISDMHGKFLSQTEEYITDAGLAASSAKMFSRGTILYTIFATLGETCILNIDATTNQAIAGISVKHEFAAEIAVEYLYYFLMSIKEHVMRVGRGVAQNNINLRILRNVNIVLPSLERQNEIVRRLSDVESMLSLRQRQAEKLDELVKARFVEMFGDPVRNTKQFPLVELQDLYDVSSSKRVYQDEMVLDGIPFLRISDIVEKSTNDKCTPQCFISQEMYDQLSQKGLTPNVGDILVTLRGTLGLCYEVKPGEKFYFQDGMISWLYNRKDCVINTYLLYAFRLPGIRKQIDGSNDGSTVSYLSIARLKRLKIELPPLALQTEFSHFVHEVDREKERIQRSAALLETLKRSLMQQYFG
ncbi:MAG: restriction endonuclease subunit S [Dialister sp.]|nr:restriction endonuclease subunit S [Dialister sp.]